MHAVSFTLCARVELQRNVNPVCTVGPLRMGSWDFAGYRHCWGDLTIMKERGGCTNKWREKWRGDNWQARTFVSQCGIREAYYPALRVTELPLPEK